MPSRGPQLGIAREDTCRVEFGRERHDVVERDGTMRRPVPEDPVHAGRTSHRASRVAPDSKVEPWVGCDGGAGAGGRAAAVLVAITPRIVRRVNVDPIASRGLSVCELRCLRLPDEHHAAVEKALDRWRGCVLGRVELPEGAVPASGAEALDVVDVLHGETHAGEGFLCGRGEVQPGGYTDGLGRCTGNLGRKDLEAAAPVRDRAIYEGLVLVVVETEGCR